MKMCFKERITVNSLCLTNAKPNFSCYLLAKQAHLLFQIKQGRKISHALFIYDFQYFKKSLKTFYFIQFPVIIFIVLLVLISSSSFRMSSHICNIVIKLLLLHRDIIISNFDSLIFVLSLSSHFCPFSFYKNEDEFTDLLLKNIQYEETDEFLLIEACETYFLAPLTFSEQA